MIRCKLESESEIVKLRGKSKESESEIGQAQSWRNRMKLSKRNDQATEKGAKLESESDLVKL